jgi:hypothetical protein
MGQTRFLIVTRPIRSSADSAAAAGPGSGSMTAGGGRSELRTVWRLLGANNRELGRGLADFPDEDSCRQAVEWLRTNIERAGSVICRDQPASMWGWRLEIDALPVALSARAYRRQRECLYNLALFRAGVLNIDPEQVIPHLVRATTRNRVELAAR